MAKQSLTPSAVKTIASLGPLLVGFPYSRLWMDYDQEVDVLYITFRRPPRATESEMLDDGILLTYSDDELVGITVFEASKRPRSLVAEPPT
jgi:uncharacterized protein YuzE